MDDLAYFPFTDPDIGTFAIDLLRPEGWLEQGEALLEAAHLLGAEAQRRWSARGSENGPHPDVGSVHRTFLMLCGFAAENFCKTVVAYQLPEDKRARVKNGGKLPADFKTHDLQRLCSIIGFSVPPEDDELVKRLEIAAVWLGRYPVPSAPADLRPNVKGGRKLWAHTMGSDEITRSTQFVQRVNSFARNSLAPRGGTYQAG